MGGGRWNLLHLLSWPRPEGKRMTWLFVCDMWCMYVRYVCVRERVITKKKKN